jgi:hypothetical protein
VWNAPGVPGDLHLQQKVKSRQAEAFSTDMAGQKKWPTSADLQAFKSLKVYKSNDIKPHFST